MTAGTLLATRRRRSSLSRSARSTLAVRSIERRVISTAMQSSSAEPATSASSSTLGGHGIPASTPRIPSAISAPEDAISTSAPRITSTGASGRKRRIIGGSGTSKSILSVRVWRRNGNIPRSPVYVVAETRERCSGFATPFPSCPTAAVSSRRDPLSRRVDGGCRRQSYNSPMTYVVTEDCIKCKHMDCVEVCPVDCFYEGENMLVIHPDECIDCGVCEPECPPAAILPDSDGKAEKWLKLNADFSVKWPNIARKGTPPPDADAWKGVHDKFEKYFSPEPGKGE